MNEREEVPNNLKKLGVHMVFNTNMEITSKARQVDDSHKTSYTFGTTHTRVVSHKTVPTAMTHVALNLLNILADDIQNDYLTTPTTEKHYIVFRHEFILEKTGNMVIINIYLYIYISI